MGKKACLSLDLEYDPEADEYHDGDEYYDTYYEEESDAQYYFPSTKGEASSSERNGTNWNSTNTSTGTACGKSMSSNLSSKAKPFTVVTPTTTAAKLHYIPNPHRQPLLTDYIATQEALLVHTVSYLSMIEVTTLSLVSKQLQESLQADGLYCTADGGAGMLLPVLRGVSHRLLPIDPIWHRPPGLSRTFAYECLAFSKSFSKTNRTIEPRCILSKKTPEQMNAVSLNNVNWKQSSCSGVGKGTKSPPQKPCMKSGVRLSYVQSESNNCALVTMWIGEHCIAELPPGDYSRQFTRERYLPPNTKTIVEASIYSDHVAMLATPLEHYSTERYILSLVVLPNIPPGIMKTALKTDQRLPKSDKHVLQWQKHLSSNNWELFSSSEIHPIVSFSSQGTYVIFGSTERWGVIGVESGSQIWSLSDQGSGRLTSLSLNIPAARTSMAPASSEHSSATNASIINAYLLQHEFLFVLERNGTFMRVYDVSDSSYRGPVAEGSIPWKAQRHNQAQGLVKLHHSHHQHHRELLRHEFELTFCAGCIWITGICNRDLLCSSPSRLLRRLRSRLPSISSTSGRDVLQLQFTRMKTDLNLGTPHYMHTWNDTHLYVVDSDRVHCWRSNNATQGKAENAADETTTISTILTCKGSFIENIQVDGTKIIASTNRTFRNTTTRDWDGSGSIWVIPIDHAFGPIYSENASTTPSPVQNLDKDELNLVGCQPYCSPVKVYHNEWFNVPNFMGSTARIGGGRPPYPISNSTNSNYQVLDISICDGRYVLSHCEKGSSRKTVIFDLYR